MKSKICSFEELRSLFEKKAVVVDEYEMEFENNAYLNSVAI